EIAKIPDLIEALNQGVDLHSNTASIVFNSNLITPEQRQIAKAINFGIVYGLTPYGLANKINSAQENKISEEDAKGFLEAYLNRYPELKTYQDKLKTGTYIETLGGRYWSNENGLNLLSDNQRLNFAIQASCAEGLKEALALIMAGKRSNWRLVNSI
ncbi:DNA polymerase, partial [Turicibacter sanguinis]